MHLNKKELKIIARTLFWDLLHLTRMNVECGFLKGIESRLEVEKRIEEVRNLYRRIRKELKSGPFVELNEYQCLILGLIEEIPQERLEELAKEGDMYALYFIKLRELKSKLSHSP